MRDANSHCRLLDTKEHVLNEVLLGLALCAIWNFIGQHGFQEAEELAFFIHGVLNLFARLQVSKLQQAFKWHMGSLDTS